MSINMEEENKFIYVWKIENFRDYFIKDLYLPSPDFMPDFEEKSKWRLALCGYSEECVLFIERIDNLAFGVKYYYNFKIICCGSKDITSNDRSMYFLKNEHDSCLDQWKSFVKFSDILKTKSKYLRGDCLTIQFSMWKDGQNQFEVPRIIAYKDIYQHKCSFIWNIENFSSVSNAEKKIYFEIDTFNLSSSILEDDDIIIKISQKNPELTRFPLKFKISLLDSKGSKRESNMQEGLFEFRNFAMREFDVSVCEFPSIYKRSKILFDEEVFLVNDVLSFHCEFSYIFSYGERVIFDFEKPSIYDTEKEPAPTLLNCNKAKRYLRRNRSSSQNIKDPVEVLQNEFNDLYYSKKMADVTIEVGDKKILAHKLVLISRSPFFASKFDKEGSNIKILDIDYNTFDNMLLFMYCAKLNNFDYGSAHKLLIAADIYQISSLKKHCSLYLKSNLCKETIFDILNTCSVANDQELKCSAVKYFKENLNDISLSSEWKEFAEKNPELANDVLNQ